MSESDQPADPVRVEAGGTIIVQEGSVLAPNFPTQPGLYLACHDRRPEDKRCNAVLEVAGRSPYLRCVLHSIGAAESEEWEPTNQRLRVGPRLEVDGRPVEILPPPTS